MIILYLIFIFLIFLYIFSNDFLNFKINNIDKEIFILGCPIILNYIMYPLIGIFDTLWINKFNSSEDLVGIDMGDQIFLLFYLIISFLPSIIPSKITELKSENKKKELKELISISFILTNILGIFSSLLLFILRNNLLQLFISKDSLIYSNAGNYLKYKSFGMVFSLTNSLIFSILRGFMELNNAIKINFKSQIINIIINPLFIKYYGIEGYAIAGILSDIYCTFNYCKIIISQNNYTKNITNFTNKSFNLIKEGIFVTIKNSLNNIVSMYANKKLISIDNTGKLLSSNIFLSRFIDICFILFYGLNSVSNVLIPSEKSIDNDKNTRRRIIFWCIITGLIQSILLYNLQFFFPYFSNDEEVIDISKKIIGPITIYQIFFGYYYVSEGILQGYSKFREISIYNSLCLIPKVILLYFSNSLQQIWLINIIIIIAKSLLTSYIIFF